MQHNLHLVTCVNQPHHILRLAKQWKVSVCNASARWALFQISFRPQQEILGDGWTIHSGPSFARLQYYLGHQILFFFFYSLGCGYLQLFNVACWNTWYTDILCGVFWTSFSCLVCWFLGKKDKAILRTVLICCQIMNSGQLKRCAGRFLYDHHHNNANPIVLTQNDYAIHICLHRNQILLAFSLGLH